MRLQKSARSTASTTTLSLLTQHSPSAEVRGHCTRGQSRVLAPDGNNVAGDILQEDGEESVVQHLNNAPPCTSYSPGQVGQTLCWRGSPALYGGLLFCRVSGSCHLHRLL
ncbi:hypothetical protein GDO81_019459 [Engystomops pustulosus]|uniref:Uncharacterized protein n=1 Tax=Engystomops pustulosus TaxID=76066 RepID=A0AAV6YKT9_ENGPU|nr:hypothetical protein GDO81_019459 [Engystomops pustulosus]